MSPIDERLKSLNIVLPDVMPPVVDGYVPAFAPFILSGDQIHLSGRLGKKDGKPLCGKVGEEISVEQGKVAARGVAVELLAVLRCARGREVRRRSTQEISASPSAVADLALVRAPWSRASSDAEALPSGRATRHPMQPPAFALAG